jgi:hypothetical protein
MINKISVYKIAVLLIAIAAVSCQKLTRPALGDYPKDVAVTPTTALRFYTPFDSTSPQDRQINIRFKDSISGYPSFFPPASITYTAGVHGTALQGASGDALKYISANDFAKASSYTIAFWIKAPGVPHPNAQFVMSLVDKDYWHNSGLFMLIDHDGAGSTPDSAAVSFVVKDNWYLFHNTDRIPKILDQQWHHLAFVYDETTSRLTTYVDGQALTGLSDAATTQAGVQGPLNLNPASVSNMILGGWNKHAKVDGPTDDWIESFPGKLDQFRMYNKALSASDILALYNSKL